MTNARIAGVADRAEARTGDMREMPFDDSEFDADLLLFLREETTVVGHG